MEASSENRVIDVVCCSAGTIKTLVDSLKEILVYGSLHFVPHDADGCGGKIRMAAVNPSCVAIVHLLLEGESFSRFHVERETAIGVNVMKLQKVVRAASANDVLNLYVTEAEPNRLCLAFENSKSRSRTLYKMSLLDVESAPSAIDPQTFTCTVSLPSVEFQKIIRDMHVLQAEQIEIKAVGDEAFVIRCDGDLCTRETIFEAGASSDFSIAAQEKREILFGVYDAHFLSAFSRCSALDPRVTVMMARDRPLMLEYSVAGLGKIRLLLSDIVN